MDPLSPASNRSQPRAVLSQLQDRPKRIMPKLLHRKRRSWRSRRFSLILYQLIYCDWFSHESSFASSQPVYNIHIQDQRLWNGCEVCHEDKINSGQYQLAFSPDDRTLIAAHCHGGSLQFGEILM